MPRYLSHVQPWLIVLGLLLTSLSAQAIPYAGENQVGLHGGIEYFIDQDNQFTTEKVLNRQADRFFTPLNSRRLPALNQDIWFRIKIDSLLKQPKLTFIGFNELLFDQLEFFYDFNGKFHHWQTGLKYPYNTRAIRTRFFSFPVHLAPEQTTTVYFRIKSTHTPLLMPNLMSGEYFPEAIELNSIYAIATLGILTGLLVTMLLMSTIALEGNILWHYNGFIASTIAMVCYLNGMVQKLLPFSTELHYGLFPIFTGLIILFQCRFIQSTFISKEATPKLYWLLNCLAPLPLITNIIFSFIDTSWGVIASGPEALILCMIFFICSIIAYCIGMPYRVLFLATSLFGILPVCMSIMINAGIIESNIGFRLSLNGSWISLALIMSIVSILKIRRYKEQKQALEKRAEIADIEQRASQEFLAKMSHEIRTPINGIIGMTDLLERSTLDMQQHQYTSVIQGSSQLLLNVVNDILDYSKIEAGEMQLENRPFDLEELIADTFLLFIKPTQEKNLSMPWSMPPTMPTHLIGDGFRLKQVLTNLLANGVKFTNSGRVGLQVEQIEKSGHQVTLKFSIFDTGIGIAQEQQSQLFNAFKQASAGISREYGGTGLGLPISSQLISMMGGELNVQSQPNEGSTFYFTIPLTVDEARHQQHIDDWQSIGGTSITIISRIQLLKTSFSHYFNFLEVHQTTFHSFEEALTNPDAIENSDIIITDSQSYIDSPDAYHQLLNTTNKPVIFLMLARHIDSLDGHIQEQAVKLLAPCSFSTIVQEIKHLSYQETFLPEATQHDAKLSGAHFLVAEDNLVNQKVIKGLLDKLHISAQLTHNGQGVVEAYRDKHASYKLVLMDCEMPGVDGYTATQQIRAFEQENGLPAKPIIALTANVVGSAHQRCLDAGMNLVLTKPIRLNELSEGLHKFL